MARYTGEGAGGGDEESGSMGRALVEPMAVPASQGQPGPAGSLVPVVHQAVSV